MPELKETIARLRELLDDCQPRKWTGHCHIEGDVEAKRQVGAKAKFLMAVMDELPTLIKSAEEVEKLRADKERLELALIRSRTELVDLQSIFYSICNGVYGSEEIMKLGYDSFCGRRSAEALRAIEAIDRSLQTHGRGSESTPEAKAEASPARKEKAE